MPVTGNKRGIQTAFHGYFEKAVAPWRGPKKVTTVEPDLKYQFYSHYHPFVTQLVQRLVNESLWGLQSADTECNSGTWQMQPK